MKLEIDPEDLTLDECEVLESLLGGSFDEAFSDGKPKSAALKVIVWLILKRDDPDVTMEDVGKLKLKALDLGDDDEPETGEPETAAAAGEDDGATPFA